MHCFRRQAWPLGLSSHHTCPDIFHRHLEKFLNGGLDLSLVRPHIHLKDKLVVHLLEHSATLGDYGLEDNSANIRNAEQEDLDAKNWYGGIYYQIAYIKKIGRKYYTLLAWDGNDGNSTKKIIDVLYFSGKNKIKFGLPIFKKNKKESQKRVIIEYDAKTSVSVRYQEKEKRIVFNHLVPPKKDLEGLEEYYIPEGTFNSYQYNKGKWLLEEDVDIRNQQKVKRIKKPKRGLVPR